MNYKKEERKLLSIIDPSLQEVLKKTGSFVAGGAVTSMFTGNDVNDIDIYVPDKKAAVAIIAWAMGKDEFTPITNGDYTGIITSFTDKSISFKSVEDPGLLCQVILIDFFKKAENIFEKFDFTCCMGAYSFEDSEFILHDDFLNHNSQRKLVFNSKTSYPLVSALRLKKYEEKGYSISKAEFIKVMLTCSSLNIESWSELASHCGGLYGVVDESIFNTNKEYSTEEAIVQLSNLEHLPSSPMMRTEVDFESFVNEIHGDDPRIESSNPKFDKSKYYIEVQKTGNHKYCYEKKELKEGQIIKEGERDIFVKKNPEESFTNSNYSYVCEIELLNGNADSKKFGSTLIKGDVRINKIFPYNFNFDPILTQYLWKFN